MSNKGLNTALGFSEPSNNAFVMVGDSIFNKPSELQVLKIMNMCKKDPSRRDIVKIFDLDLNGGCYELIIREDGKLANEFTSEFYKATCSELFDLL